MYRLGFSDPHHGRDARVSLLSSVDVHRRHEDRESEHGHHVHFRRCHPRKRQQARHSHDSVSLDLFHYLRHLGKENGPKTGYSRQFSYFCRLFTIFRNRRALIFPGLSGRSGRQLPQCRIRLPRRRRNWHKTFCWLRRDCFLGSHR